MKTFNSEDRLKLHPKSSKTLESFWKNNFNLINTFDYIIIGKPFGCNCILESFDIKDYPRIGIEHDLIDKIYYADYTLGNSLGIAQGINIAEPDKKVFVLLSDAQLNMGSIIEAFISIPKMCKNITVFVDLNRTGSKGPLTFFPDEKFNGWNVFYRKRDTRFLTNEGLNLVYFNTSQLNITEV
jgi:hypothetical protein